MAEYKMLCTRCTGSGTHLIRTTSANYYNAGVYGTDGAYFGFDRFEDDIGRRIIKPVEFVMYCDATTSINHGITPIFAEITAAWLDQAGKFPYAGNGKMYAYDTGLTNITPRWLSVRLELSKPCINGIAIATRLRQVGEETHINIRTNLTSTPPHIIVEAQAVELIAKDFVTPTALYRGVSSQFAWNMFYQDNGDVKGRVLPASQIFRVQNAQGAQTMDYPVLADQKYCDFNPVDISGDTMRWQIGITSNSGAVTWSEWQTATIKTVSMRLEDIYPSSGKTLYRGFSAVFRWLLTCTIPEGCTGKIVQTSATLQWRVTGTTAINNINIAGNNMTCTVGGMVFPAGSVDWRVQSNDSGGGSTTSTWTTIAVEKIPVTADGIYPADGSRILKATPNRFGWNLLYDTEKALGIITQTKAVIEWRQRGSNTITPITISGGANAYTFPANYFTVNDIEWRVTLTTSNQESSTSAWTHVNTQDDISTPQCTSPVGTIIDDKDGINFTWTHIIGTGTAQTAYDVQISTDYGGSYTTIGTAQTADHSIHVARGKFEQGQLYWRVRTRNGDNVWSETSPACTFILRRAPETPVIISADSTPRPIIKWQSSDQAGYRLQIINALGETEYDSEERRSADKQHRVPYLLCDGPKTATLTIKTMYGIESLPTSINLTTKNVPGENITLQSAPAQCCAGMTWTTSGEYAFFVIMRDGKAIARTGDTAYTDALCVGWHTYIVRGVFADGNYSDSNKIDIETIVPHGVISEVSAIEWKLLKLSDKALSEKDQTSAAIELRYYDGRALPVALVGDSVGGTRSLSYIFKTAAEYNALKSLTGKTVVYKNYRGSVYIGTMGALTAVIDKHIAVTFDIFLSEFAEDVEYD